MTTTPRPATAILWLSTPTIPRYRLVAVPGTEMTDADDKRGCEWCNVTHAVQNCPAIRAELMKGETR
jgi:hypothetical protein